MRELMDNVRNSKYEKQKSYEARNPKADINKMTKNTKTVRSPLDFARQRFGNLKLFRPSSIEVLIRRIEISIFDI